MRKLRGTVLFAWVSCLGTGASSVASLVLTLQARSFIEQPVGLIAEGLLELIPVLFVIPGALIITRHPRHVIGWLLVAPGLFMMAVTGMNFYLASYMETPPPPTLPNLLMYLFSGSAWVALIFPLFLIPLLFPTGRPPTPRWRWIIYLAVAMILVFFIWAAGSPVFQIDLIPWIMHNPYAFLPAALDPYFMPVWTALLMIMTLASLSSVVVRYRRSSVVERQQIKWLLYAVILFGLVYTFFVGPEATGVPLLDDLINLVFALAVIAIPVAIAMAILRYHLFDIDVIIRMTLLYALVTGLLGLLYIGGIVLLQEIFRTQTGQVSEIAIVITTLIIASLFNPLRRRIQAVIDRRFFRQKYNADQALAEFASTARSGADLDDLTGILVDLAQKLFQPTQVSLYLQPRQEKQEEANLEAP